MAHESRLNVLALAVTAGLAVPIMASNPVLAESEPNTAAPVGPGIQNYDGTPPRLRPKGLTRSSLKTFKKSTTPAKVLFGGVKTPAQLKARSFGKYARGCLSGGKALAVNGRGWQVMRLSRNRNWGHPALIAYLEKLAGDAPGLGWRGLLVGDLAQPRGGPMLTGHASHQIGLDADIWLKPMPAHTMSTRERENVSAVSMLKKGTRRVDKNVWTATHARLIRRAASDGEVARIFVHPGIKKALCDWAGGDRGWLRKIRPWYGHHYHFHVRLKCPASDGGCVNQAAPPPGDGCGKNLAWWLSDKPWAKPKKKPKKKPRKRQPVTLAHLPSACETVLLAK